MDWKELTQTALEMMDALQARHLGEVEIQNDDCRICIKAAPVAPTAVVQATAAPAAAGADATDAVAETANQLPAGTRVEAPLVGTFYAAPGPDAPPFVLVGQTVKKGDTLFIIEAMKTMNEIKAPCDGTVLRVLAQPGDLVEYKQVLVIIG